MTKAQEKRIEKWANEHNIADYKIPLLKASFDLYLVVGLNKKDKTEENKKASDFYKYFETGKKANELSFSSKDHKKTK